jgi:nicotinamidase-related amidase
MTKAVAAPGKTLLTPNDHTLIMIDFQSQMAFATKSIDATTLRNNAALVSNSAVEFNVSTLCGLWTSVCIVGPALSALDQGFEVYVITDACGDISDEAHNQAITRMVQAGARPMTSLQYLLELQRDWARQETYMATYNNAVANGGAYGLGLIYATTMFPGAHEG